VDQHGRLFRGDRRHPVAQALQRRAVLRHPLLDSRDRLDVLVSNGRVGVASTIAIDTTPPIVSIVRIP
jgi:hypothetical protein